MASDEHLVPLGRIAVLSADLERVAVGVFGLLLDLDDARPGDIVSAGMPVSWMLERTKALAALKLPDTSKIDDWVALAKEATTKRNEMLHSGWWPGYDHAAGRDTLARQRRNRRGEWDVQQDVATKEIEAVAVLLMSANAAGNSAYIATERTLMGR